MTPSIARESIGGVGSISTAPNPFHKLVADLSKILGPSSGLTSKDVDIQQLRNLMEEYISQEEHWREYAFADLSLGYTRNLVDEGNGKCNLLVLVWSPRKGSLIHDHADAHCLMKVLHGTLLETRYSIPKSSPESETPLPPQVIKNTLYTQDEVAYMADDLGLHKISNPDLDGVAVSLHLYTPPNAAREGCNIFDERTGEKSHVTQSNFYSAFGKKFEA